MNEWWLIALAFVLAFVSTPLAMRAARAAGVMTDPRKNPHPGHTHAGALPRWGGIPVYVAFAVPALFFAFENRIVLWMLIGATITVAVGLIDDRYDVSPYLRFMTNILAALSAVVGGIGIPFLTNPLGGKPIALDTLQFSFVLFNSHFTLLWLADIAAILWIVWCMNMVNWSKGIDGQLPGFVAIAAIVLGLLAMRFTRHDISTQVVMILSFVTAASYAGFLPWNFYPQRILAGYGAGSLAGYLLAILAILSWGKLGTLLLVLSLPLADGLFVFFTRVKTHRSPFRGDRNHLHHSLLDMGWGRRRIAIFYWIVSAILGVFALNVNSQQKLFGFLIIGAVLIGIVVWSYKMRQQLT